jgi:hypothetical protein
MKDEEHYIAFECYNVRDLVEECLKENNIDLKMAIFVEG